MISYIINFFTKDKKLKEKEEKEAYLKILNSYNYAITRCNVTTFGYDYGQAYFYLFVNEIEIKVEKSKFGFFDSNLSDTKKRELIKFELLKFMENNEKFDLFLKEQIFLYFKCIDLKKSIESERYSLIANLNKIIYIDFKIIDICRDKNIFFELVNLRTDSDLENTNIEREYYNLLAIHNFLKEIDLNQELNEIELNNKLADEELKKYNFIK